MYNITIKLERNFSMYDNLMDTIGFLSKSDPEVGQAMEKELARPWNLLPVRI